MKRGLRILALILSLTLLTVASTSCMTVLQIADMKAKWDAGEFSPKGNEWLSYTLSEADKTAFDNALTRFAEAVRNDADPSEIEDALMEFEELYYHISTQSQIAYIIYNQNLKDKTASENYLFASEMEANAMEAYMAICREIDASDYAYRDTFFMTWSEDEMAQMRSYTEAVSAIKKDNEELLVKYRDLNDGSGSYRQDVAKLYYELVTNNQKMAKEFGFDSYYDFAYEYIYCRDYTPEETEQMRSYVKEALVPMCKRIYDDFYEGMEALSEKEQDRLIDFFSTDYQKLATPWVEEYFNSLPNSMRYYMVDALESGRVVYATNKNAQEGAFTAYLYEQNHPVLYFSEGYRNNMTVAHEAGHYYALSVQKGLGASIDMAEVYSQSNEFLMLAYLKNAGFDEKLYEVIVDYQLYNALATIIVSTIIDEFEQVAYEKYEEFSPTNCVAWYDRWMNEICKDYGGKLFVDEYLTDIYYYWRYVVLEQPVYYISYAMSGVAALQIYQLALTDYNAALVAYQGLVHNPVDVDGFLENLKGVGLTSPLEEGTYWAIRDLFE